MTSSPPVLPKPWLIRGIFATFSLIVVGVGLAFTATSAALSVKFLFVLIAIGFVFVAYRAATVGVGIEADTVRVRNLFRTRTVGLKEVTDFGVGWNVLNGGPAVAINVKAGRKATCDAYPITRILGLAARRRQMVDGLNLWLRTRAEDF